MKRKHYFIATTSLLACLALYTIEQILVVDYVIKTLSKILLFICVPILFFKLNRTSIKDVLFDYRTLEKKDTKLSLLLGLTVFFIIIVAYYLLKEFVNLDLISKELIEKSNITPSVFLFVAIYVTLGNSFLEEFFFRGFIFSNLYNVGKRKLAYIFSSGLFAVYHIAIFKTWFNFGISAIVLLSLFFVGFVFSWLNRKSKNFLNSWIIHVFADLAIVLIGFRLFGII